MNHLSFLECFTDVTGGNKKINRTQYLSSGRYPIVDQSKKSEGFTNDKNALFKGGLPCIVYGDHSKTVKYIDYDFAIGSEGVKVLTAKEDINLKYGYYYLSTIKLPNYGYDRSFKYLKKIKIPIPPLDQQNLIVALLDKISSVLENKTAITAILNKLKSSLFHNTFGDMYNNTHNYKLIKLKNLVRKDKIITYGIVQPGPNVEEGVPLIKAGDIKKGRILIDQLHKTSNSIAEKFERSKCAAGDIVISIRATVGAAAIVPPELDGVNLTQDTARISADEEVVDKYFLYNAISSKGIYSKIMSRTKGSTLKGISLADLREIEIPVPDKSKQIEFKIKYLILDTLLKYHENSLSNAQSLFKSVLYKSFKGERLVNEEQVFNDLILGLTFEDISLSQARCSYLISMLNNRSATSVDIYEKAKELCFALLKAKNSPIEQIYEPKRGQVILKLKP